MSKEEQYEAMELADEKGQIGYVRYLSERFLREHPNDVPTLIRHACSLISLARYEDALRALDHAQTLVPKERLHLVLAQRGHLLEAQGDFSDAEEMFMQALKLEPDDATYLVYAGCVAFRRGDLDRAQTLARKATDCSEGCIDEALFNLGGYLLSAGQYSEAADCYRKALQIDPEYALAKERLEDVDLILKEGRPMQ